MRASSGYWRLAQLAAVSWVPLHRHSYVLQLFPEDRSMSKIILPFKKLFFLKLCWHLYFIAVCSTSDPDLALSSLFYKKLFRSL